MRRIGTSGFMMRSSSKALRLSAVVLGVGLLMAAGAARAGDDDEDDDKTFEEKVIEGIMKGMGATNMENSEHRLSRAFAAGRAAQAGLATAGFRRRRKDRAELAEGSRRSAPQGGDRSPQERGQGPAKSRTCPDAVPNSTVGKTTPTARTNNDPIQPGVTNNPVLSPSQLGFTGFGNIFGGNKTETAPFKGEPTRESLTQPPPGYQTPSSSFAYGTGPKESLNKEYNPATRQVWRIV